MKRETYYRILHLLAGIAIGYWLFHTEPKVEYGVIEVPKEKDITDGLTGRKLTYYENLYARKNNTMD